MREGGLICLSAKSAIRNMASKSPMGANTLLVGKRSRRGFFFFLRQGFSHFVGVSDKTVGRQKSRDKSGDTSRENEHFMSR